MRRLVLLVPAALLLAGCAAQQSFSDGYVTADFVTNPANHEHGTVVKPGTYEVEEPSDSCQWDAENLRTGERSNHYRDGWQVTLGEEHWLHSKGCGTWREVS